MRERSRVSAVRFAEWFPSLSAIRSNLPVILTPTYHPAVRPQGPAWCSTRAALRGDPGTSDSWTRSEMAPTECRQALASNGLFGDCQPTSQVITKPGNFIAAVRDSLNTRFDFSGNGSTCSQPPCSPSTNVAKDVVRGSTCSWAQNAATSTDMATNTPHRYFPDSPIADLCRHRVTPQIMGHPRDRCHYFNPSKTNPSYPLLCRRKNWRRQLGSRGLFSVKPS